MYEELTQAEVDELNEWIDNNLPENMEDFQKWIDVVFSGVIFSDTENDNGN